MHAILANVKIVSMNDFVQGFVYFTGNFRRQIRLLKRAMWLFISINHVQGVALPKLHLYLGFTYLASLEVIS